jgi:hypothetical protein
MMEPLRVEEFSEGDQVVVRTEIPGIDPEKDFQITATVRVPPATRRSSTTGCGAALSTCGRARSSAEAGPA